MRTILITLGDPCGLGPELVCRLLGHMPACAEERLLLLGPEAALVHHHPGAPFWKRLAAPGDVFQQPAGLYLYEPPALAGTAWRYGAPTVEGGAAAGASLDAAMALTAAGLAAHESLGLVTCPLNKAMLQDAGYGFPGHTEYLAERLGVGRDNICMHLGGPRLRVSLVTTHPPLAGVAALITPERVLRCLTLTADYLARLGVSGSIAVCGLNPHAGESGHIGREEIDAIVPAIEVARTQGLEVEGPLPGDTVFYFAAQGRYAAVLAMYHDQGLAPLKLLHFSEAVNTTLGLPIPRTSPDHGTGYDIVGTGRGRPTSLAAALAMAQKLTATTE